MFKWLRRRRETSRGLRADANRIFWRKRAIGANRRLTVGNVSASAPEPVGTRLYASSRQNLSGRREAKEMRQPPRMASAAQSHCMAFARVSSKPV